MGLAGLAVAGLGVLAFGNVTARQPSSVVHPYPGDMAMRGLRTSIDAGGGRRGRVAADSLRLVRPRALGPFRLGSRGPSRAEG